MNKSTNSPENRLFIKQFTETLNKLQLVNSGDQLIVAVSGGPDSTSLLHLLHTVALNLNLIACYIDHGLRPDEVMTEIELISGHCQALNIPFKQISVDVKAACTNQHLSLEEAARKLRYQALEELRIKTGARSIAVGHTADDQAEELLIRLIRGSGRGGLSAMRFKNSRIIRPLLGIRKKNLLDYLEQEKIHYCTDSSNLSRAFLRNRIRLDLLPFLRDFNPSISTTLLQTIDILQEEESLLENICQSSYLQCVQENSGSKENSISGEQSILLKRPAFLDLHPAIQRRILEMILWKMDAKPGFRQIKQLLQLVSKKENSGECHLEKGLRVRRNREGLLFHYPLGKKSFRGSG